MINQFLQLSYLTAMVKVVYWAQISVGKSN